MEEPKYITTETQICTFIGDVGELYSTKSAHKRLTKFKECLFYCSSYLSEPMFSSISEEALSMSGEILNIHELMYNFMCNKNHSYLKFTVLNNISSRFEPSSFSWNIPEFVVPFLVSYILTSYENIKHPSEFFPKLEEYFNTALEKMGTKLTYNKEGIANQYEEWTNDYLGRQYFCTLDSLYGTFSKTDEQEKVIRSSVNELTRILVECPQFPSKIPAYVTQLLKHYEMNLIKKVPTSNPTKEELLSYYKHDDPWEIRTEFPFILFVCEKLSCITQNLCKYIEDSFLHDQKPSDYNIAIKHFDKFQKKYCDYLQEIDHKLECLDKEFRDFFDATKNTPPIPQAVKEWRLSIELANEEKHINTFTTHISNCYAQIKKDFTGFLRLVKYASGENPQNHKTLRTGRDYYHELTQSIAVSKHNLSQKLEESYGKLPHILVFHNPGYIENSRYPTNLFHEDDILQIVYVLDENHCNLPKEHIISHFKNKGLHFPMVRPEVISFLLDFDRMIAGL